MLSRTVRKDYVGFGLFWVLVYFGSVVSYADLVVLCLLILKPLSMKDDYFVKQLLLSFDIVFNLKWHKREVELVNKKPSHVI